MSMFATTATLERRDELHMARLLLLLRAFAGQDGTGSIQGLTKLAKLDFLLRYPTYLEKALEARGYKAAGAEVQEHERRSIESGMVRYRYGPWDFRYRRFANLLVGKGLAEVRVHGKSVNLSLTPTGLEAAALLASGEEFQDIARRARHLHTHFNYRGSWLKNFVYSTFPEVVSLRLGEEIPG